MDGKEQTDELKRLRHEFEDLAEEHKRVAQRPGDTEAHKRHLRRLDALREELRRFHERYWPSGGPSD